MKNLQVTDCTQPATSKLERVNFFNGQLLTAADMTTECDYFLQKLRRHNRFLHGWGVVCGLAVTAAPVTATPWRVQIGSGYALGPYGDEIFVGEAVYFDLAACLSGGTTSPCEPNMVTSGGAGTSTIAYLAIQYAECQARPVQVAASGCGCGNDPCQYSRLLDSFTISCLAQLPQPPAEPPTLCQVNQGTLAPCLPCPADPRVVLAQITLPSASTMNITNSSIDNVSHRRVIVSTAVLQDQVVRCCCGQAPPPPPPSPPPILKQILVSQPGQKAWATSVTLGDISPAPFDYELVLSGAAPAGGFPVTVTAVASPADRGVSVQFSTSMPVVVPQGNSSVIVANNSVDFIGGGKQIFTFTLTASDSSGNKSTATVNTQGLA